MNLKKLTQPMVRCAYFAPLLAALSFISSCQKDAATTPVSEDANLKDLNTTSSAAATASKYKFSNPISLNGAHDITISGDSINGGSQVCINLVGCNNIHITNCRLGNSKTLGIQLSNCTNILIDYNYITNVSTGVYAVGSKTVRVNYNEMKNMQGPYPRGAFVQFDNVSGGYNRVSFNKFENIMGASYPEDAISMYKSNGIASDPIYIIGNWIRGGGPSKTGGGIMLGDNGGSYQTASANILVDPGQYGMAVSGGTNMQITNNSIYAKAQSFTNVGLYYWNQSGLSSSAVTISGNKVNFTSGMYGKNNSYIGSGSATPTGWSTNTWNASITASILPATIIPYK
ncbi:MAG TPA: right-handed parallel beta-helix repeat-containing protein [Mucilaginibacter sp.]|nr:right-handed parallel beta-helix repeat-containing protein [Mucilaginibacter sp.]